MPKPQGLLEIVATCHTAADMLAALRARADGLGLTRATIGTAAGLASGHAEKLLCDPPLRQIAWQTLEFLLPALGLKMLLAVDDQSMERVRKMPRRKVNAQNTQQPRKLRKDSQLRERLAQIGRKGALSGHASPQDQCARCASSAQGAQKLNSCGLFSAARPGFGRCHKRGEFTGVAGGKGRRSRSSPRAPVVDEETLRVIT